MPDVRPDQRLDESTDVNTGVTTQVLHDLTAEELEVRDDQATLEAFYAAPEEAQAIPQVAAAVKAWMRRPGWGKG